MSRSKYAGNRNSRNLCPNCFSTLKLNEENEKECSGDRLELWRAEIQKYEAMEIEEKNEYLKSLENPYKFLDLVGNLDLYGCNYSDKLVSIYKDYTTRIPDPMAVNVLEKKLKRKLTEEELQEGYEFTDQGTSFNLPFCNFPEDLT